MKIRYEHECHSKISPPSQIDAICDSITFDALKVSIAYVETPYLVRSLGDGPSNFVFWEK